MKRKIKLTRDYKIDRHKFFDTHEREAIMENTRRMARQDEKQGRKTWPMRWMLVHLVMHSGLRVSEIAALKIRDTKCEIEQPYIRVQSSKLGKSRDVYIDRDLANHLWDFIWTDTVEFQPLFVGSKGKHYTTTGLNRAFKAAVISAGLRTDLSIHSARHTYATLLLHHTGNIRYVQKQLGHASINMTALYADVLPEQNGKLANMILDTEGVPPIRAYETGSGTVDTLKNFPKKLTRKPTSNKTK